jgi:hypothetical protein
MVQKPHKDTLLHLTPTRLARPPSRTQARAAPALHPPVWHAQAGAPLPGASGPHGLEASCAHVSLHRRHWWAHAQTRELARPPVRH